MAKESSPESEETNQKGRCQGVTIDALPNEVLLEIFDFYVNGYGYAYENRKQGTEEWQTLAHVCRRWRTTVFGSTIRLELRLVCTSKTPALEVWPALPLLIQDEDFLSESADNIVAALECSDRVDRISLWHVGGSPMEKVLSAMQVPFPKLTHLLLKSKETVTVLPDYSFLDGRAPNLRSLWLDHIPIPGLPGLLLRSTELSNLQLYGVPHSGYFSPEELATCLSTLRNLGEFTLKFVSPLSRPGRHPPPLKHSLLPVLTKLTFKGVSEYLEDLVAHIDAPQLYRLNITFFNQIDFDTPQLVRFISHTPGLNAIEEAHLHFRGGAAGASLQSLTNQQKACRVPVNVEILCGELDWQVSSLEQLFAPFSPSIFTPEDLYIYQTRDLQPDWKDNVEDALWLELLHPFASVKNLYVSKEFASRIVPSLQELVGGGTTEVLPTLQNIFIQDLEPSGPVKGAIETFVAARRLSGRPITVSRWARDWKRERLLNGP